jgi:DNA-binding CsgD family transcriptional regulator
MKQISKIKKTWFNNNRYFAKEPSILADENIKNRIASIFCPGDFYYFVFDFGTYQFSTVSENYERIIGLDPNNLTIDGLFSRVHPDDVDFYSRCEKYIGDFIFKILTPSQILNYKFSYSFRNRVADGSYKLFLQQVVTLSIDEKGRLGKTFGVHSDISHIATISNRKVSFLGLNGEPSFINIDVYNDSLNFLQEEKTHLTSRELEILRLLAEGRTAIEIGAALFISEGTVRKHRENLLKKTHSKNTAQMVSKSIRNGII